MYFLCISNLGFGLYFSIKHENKYLQELKDLRHYKDSSEGLICIDREPKEVTKEWIEQNSFQLEYTGTKND